MTNIQTIKNYPSQVVDLEAASSWTIIWSLFCNFLIVGWTIASANSGILFPSYIFNWILGFLLSSLVSFGLSLHSAAFHAFHGLCSEIALDGDPVSHCTATGYPSTSTVSCNWVSSIITKLFNIKSLMSSLFWSPCFLHNLTFWSPHSLHELLAHFDISPFTWLFQSSYQSL